MHDSGVRRFKRAAGGWFKKGLSFVIPMAPRKHNDEQPQVDKSQITWRAFLTSMLLLLFPGVQNRIGLSDGDQTTRVLQNTVDRIERRMTALESRADQMDTRISNLVDAFIKGARL